MQEALELRGQHQVDDRQGDREGEIDLPRRLDELPRGAGEVHGEAAGKLVVDDLLHASEGAPEGGSRGEIGGDGGGALQVVVVQAGRADPRPRFDEARERNHRVAPGAQVNLAQVIGHAAEGRLQGHHDVVLSVAQNELVGGSLGDQQAQALRHGSDRHADVGRPLPVEGDVELRILEEQVAVHVPQVGQLSGAREDALRQRRELVQARGRTLDDDLDVAEAAPAERGRVDGEDHGLGDLEEAPEEPGDDLLLLDVPLVPVAEPREDVSQRGVPGPPPAGADDGEEALDLGDRAEPFLDLHQRLTGVGGRGALRRADDREDAAAVLDGQEGGVDRPVEQQACHHDAEQQDPHAGAAGEDRAQQPLVEGTGTDQGPLDPSGDGEQLPAHLQEPRAQHRHHRERDEGRDAHGHREADGELAKQAARITGHQGERDQHRHHGRGGGDHRKAHLLGAVEGRQTRGLPELLPAVDVLQHHDGVVHQETDREQQGEQREQIDGEAQRLEDREGPHQRHRNRDDGDGRRRGRMQEEQVDEHDDHEHDRQGLRDLPQRLPDEDREVHRQAQFDAFGQRPLDFGQLGQHGAGDRQLVRPRLPDDPHPDDVVAGEAGDLLVVLGPELHPADVPDADRNVVVLADDDRLEAGGALDLGVGVDRELARGGLQLAGGNLQVALLDGAADVEGVDLPRRHSHRVEPHPHGVAPLSADDRPRHAGQQLQRGADDPVGDVGQIDGGVVGALHVEPHDRPAVRSGLAHDRPPGRVRQAVEGALDDVGHVGGGDVDVAPCGELHVDRAHAEGAPGLDAADSLDAVHHPLERLGDGGLHGLRAGARIDRGDRDQRVVDVGVLADGQGEEGHRSGHHDEQAHHGGQHRPLDRELRDPHGESAQAATGPKRPSSRLGLSVCS